MERITAVAITLAAVLGCSYACFATAVATVEMRQKLAEMGRTIVDARNRGYSLESIIKNINGSDMPPAIKSGMTRIAVTIYSNPSLKTRLRRGVWA